MFKLSNPIRANDNTSKTLFYSKAAKAAEKLKAREDAKADKLKARGEAKAEKNEAKEKAKAVTEHTKQLERQKIEMSGKIRYFLIM